MSANGVGGEVNPMSATKIVFFFLNEKRFQNVLKHKNIFLEVFRVISIFSFVGLYHSESIDMQIKKNNNKHLFYSMSAKTDFFANIFFVDFRKGARKNLRSFGV